MRTKLLYIIGLWGFLSLVACSDDDTLSPSDLDGDWYVLTDSDDALDHLRYTIYETYNVPIFYNDTIGHQIRGTDNAGEAIIYYEVLNPNYSILSSDEYAKYELSYNRDAITVGVEFIRDKVFPKLISDKLYPRSFLLVKSLTLNAMKTSSYPYAANSYRGMMTSCVGSIEEMEGMTEVELKRLGCEVAAQEYTTYLTESASSLLEAFLNVSRAEIYSANLYGLSLTSSSTPPYVADLEEYGFLSYNKGAQYNETSKRVTTVNEYADVLDYVTEVLMDDDEAFEVKYGTYEWVMKKYELMKTAMENLKATLK
ncbi:hypothetical protein [Butyricimonas sp. Marseille-P3923]|uniref:hypothetical protein n=1 Tax=Butyricimonas sp. Marseille-P3923 TaxID=1987504 RepID=UPI000C07E927|nr:hypothetical protein [Butyricimonas sp. Marseille-P3923]